MELGGEASAAALSYGAAAGLGHSGQIGLEAAQVRRWGEAINIGGAAERNETVEGMDSDSVSSTEGA